MKLSVIKSRLLRSSVCDVNYVIDAISHAYLFALNYLKDFDFISCVNELLTKILCVFSQQIKQEFVFSWNILQCYFCIINILL